MIAIIVGIVFNLFAEVSGPIDEVRNQFLEVSSLEQVDSFIKILEKNPSVEAEGYYATMLFMKSKFVKFPITKYKYFKKGKKQLDSLINNNKNNVEIRYLRFLLQSEIPKFLGYYKNIEDDYLLIMNGIETSKLESDFKIKMLNNMLLVSELSVEKSKQIKRKLNIIR